MPYTPPSQRSPASSKTNSPILSRNHSYVETAPAVQRPALPRSVSSASYLAKHRRSPSFPTVDLAAVNGPVNATLTSPAVDAASRGASSHGSLRQAPQPLNDSLIPPGAITTPPDSSDDEERGRRNEGTLRELQEVLHSHIDIKRVPSPTRDATTATPTNTPAPATGSLTPEARKISHSRSSSEITLLQHVLHPMNADATTSSSDGSDAEDDELRIKPPLLRKKSGELVKPALRPPSSRRRPSSMPGTPTYSKAVHFNEDIEQVRHFLQVDRPIAVSAGSSPVETYDSESEYPFGGGSSRAPKAPEWDIKLTNFPATDSYERQTAPVRVERIFLASDNKTLVGSIACANIAFQKLVVARFTLDYWKTTSEVVAEFNHDVRKKQKDDGYDRFNFNIKLADQANLESKTLLLCARYLVNGQEFWDNNASMNYQVDFSKKVKQRESKRSTVAAGGLGAIPRSRHSPLAPRPRSMPPAASDEDFGHDYSSKFQFGSSAGGVTLNDSPNVSIRLKPRSKRGSIFPDQAPQRSAAGQPFAARYDFGASLSAALSSAQDAMGERSGLKINTAANATKGYFDRPAPVLKAHSTGPSVPGRPDSLSLEKPDLQSAEYNELIQKFCFFGTPTGKTSSPDATPAMDTAQSDGTMDSAQEPASHHSSASSSPDSPVMPLFVDGASDMAQIASPFLSRSASPGPVTGSTPEDLLASQYPFGFNNMPGGMFPERSATPQACV